MGRLCIQFGNPFPDPLVGSVLPPEGDGQGVGIVLGLVIGCLEVPMNYARRWGAVGLLIATMMLGAAGSMLSACNTVAGAGQDVSAVGNTVTTGATQTKRALP